MKLITLYNLYKGGSLTIYKNLSLELSKRNDVYQLTSDRMCVGSPSVRYPLSRFNKIYRIFLDHVYTAFLATFFKVESLIMMGNFPCIFWFGKQSCYFHNTLYLSNQKCSLAQKLEVKFFRAALHLKPKCRLLVQTEAVREALRKEFPERQVDICPMFTIQPTKTSKCSSSTRRLKLFYPAFNYPHKNHDLLYRTCDSLIDVEILLTTSTHEVKEKKGITHLGELTQSDAIKTMCESDALIFPSLHESLGLPLLEAAINGIPIIAAKLPYVDAVIENYYAFDPNDENSFLEAVNNFRDDKWNKKARKAKCKLVCDTKLMIGTLLNE